MSRPTPQEIQDIRDQAKLEEAYMWVGKAIRDGIVKDVAITSK